MLNKPIESICGYLTVLPGAFSAFRWAAVEVRLRWRDCWGGGGLAGCAGWLASGGARIGAPPLASPLSAPTTSPSFHTHTELPPTPTPPLLPPPLQGEPLRRYFYGLYSQNDLSAFEANMYLAEDRVLCLEIVARKNSKY